MSVAVMGRCCWELVYVSLREHFWLYVEVVNGVGKSGFCREVEIFVVVKFFCFGRIGYLS